MPHAAEASGGPTRTARQRLQQGLITRRCTVEAVGQSSMASDAESRELRLAREVESLQAEVRPMRQGRALRLRRVCKAGLLAVGWARSAT